MERSADYRAWSVADADCDAAVPDGARGADLRAAPRFALLVRSAKLIADGRELLCILRDASASGVKVRLFHALPADARLHLELPDGSRHGAELVWCAADHAGLRFHREIDIRAAIDPPRNERADGAAFPKRQLRARVDRAAVLHSEGVDHPVLLHNISQAGAGIECAERLMLRQPVRLDAPGAPPLHAKVCWRRAPHYGLVFEQGFTLETLARLVAQLNQIS